MSTWTIGVTLEVTGLVAISTSLATLAVTADEFVVGSGEETANTTSSTTFTSTRVLIVVVVMTSVRVGSSVSKTRTSRGSTDTSSTGTVGARVSSVRVETVGTGGTTGDGSSGAGTLVHGTLLVQVTDTTVVAVGGGGGRVVAEAGRVVVLVVVTNGGVVGGRSKAGSWVLGPTRLGGTRAGRSLVDGSGTGLTESVSVSDTSGVLTVGFVVTGQAVADTSADTGSSKTAVVVVVIVANTCTTVLVRSGETSRLVVTSADAWGASSEAGSAGGTGRVVLERFTTCSSRLTRDESGVWVE